MAQWTVIEDETGLTYVTSTPHFAWENGHAAFRTDDVDVSAAVINGRLLKVIVTDNDAVEAVGFVAMREKTAESLSADLAVLNLLDDLEGADLLIGEGALGDMTAGSFTYTANWSFAGNVFTRTAEAADNDIVHDDNATAGALYKCVITVATISAGGFTPQVGATSGTEITTAIKYSVH